MWNTYGKPTKKRSTHAVGSTYLLPCLQKKDTDLCPVLTGGWEYSIQFETDLDSPIVVGFAL